MIAPLVGYGIKGFIWYQGEKDSGLYREYPRTFKAMLADLRRSWGQDDFPFLFVQLATYKGWGDVQAAPDPEPNEGTWGFIREAQTKCLAEPNTAMAVALDRVDFNDAHPKNKQAVGHRLALAALANVYGRDIVWCGPMYESMQIEENKIRLRFRHVGGGPIVDGARGKNGFAIAGADRNFVWADVAVDGDTLLVWRDEIASPVAVRYAWANFPYFGLHNREGLPAPTFRTDDW
jgi:sialate O-acetylesterase